MNPVDQNLNTNPNQGKIGQIIAFIQTNKLIALAGVVLFTIIILIIGITATNNRTSQILQTGNTTDSQQGQQTPTPAVQQPFKVLETSPVNNETAVYPGEIVLTVKTNVEILSPDEFSLAFSPELPYFYKTISSFPANTLEVQIYGGLQQNTKYTVSLLNKNQTPVYSWSFTTSNEQPESSSSLVEDQEKKTIQQNYPLFDYIPYESANFNADYTKALTLEVIIKNPDTTTVKQEVDAWIRSHNVDPATHTINYVNDF